MSAMSVNSKKSTFWDSARSCGIVDEKLTEYAKFPPIKSSPSFGPTLPDSKPLNLLDGIVIRSDNFISLLFIEFALSK